MSNLEIRFPVNDPEFGRGLRERLNARCWEDADVAQAWWDGIQAFADSVAATIADEVCRDVMWQRAGVDPSTGELVIRRISQTPSK